MTKNNRDKDVQFIEALAVLLREHDLNEVEVIGNLARMTA